MKNLFISLALFLLCGCVGPDFEVIPEVFTNSSWVNEKYSLDFRKSRASLTIVEDSYCYTYSLIFEVKGSNTVVDFMPDRGKTIITQAFYSNGESFITIVVDGEYISLKRNM